MAVGKLMDIKRFAVHDGPGIRTTFFLKGCSLKCIWCHNPEGISPRPSLAYYAHKCISCGECTLVCPNKAHTMDENGHRFDRSLCTVCGKCTKVCLGEALTYFGRDISVEEALNIAREDKSFYDQSCGGVTLSGGEPLLQADFCADFAGALKQEGISTAIDTCGNVPWKSFEKLLGIADIFLFDVKHIDPEIHRSLTGADNRLILSNLHKLSENGARIEIRMPLVPGCNDSDETVRGIGAFLGKLNIEKMRVLPYHSLARSKYAALGMPDTMPDVPSPDEEKLQHVRGILSSYGIPVADCDVLQSAAPLQ